MHASIRDVILPVAAAVGFLAAATFDVAGANVLEDAAPSAVASAARPEAPGQPAPRATGEHGVESPSTPAEAQRERRCTSVERIGKVRIQRCQ
jgi:hypothetical protein